MDLVIENLIAMPLILLILCGSLYLLFQMGSYQFTGTTGWRRIIAGWRLFIDLLELHIARWYARNIRK